LVEIRANTFASRYLLPPDLLKKIPVSQWSTDEVLQWASKLKVSTLALIIGLKETGLVNDNAYRELVKVRVPASLKSDPELDNLSGRPLERKRSMLEQGLSYSYVSLCFDALGQGIITNARAAEILLTTEDRLAELSDLFGVKLLVHE
jgi:hypothetical protein